MVAFRFKNASCVAVGTFNIYIIQPAWLVEVEILPKGIPIAIESNMDEPGFRFSSPKLPMKWFIAPNRIMITTESPAEDCGSMVAKVLENLPWTPLTAIGSNAIYTAPISDLGALTARFRDAPTTPTGYGFKQRSFHFGVSRGNRVFNLQLSVTDAEIDVSINAHTDLQEEKDGKRASKAAQEAANRFLQDRLEADSLVQNLFQVRIEDASSDAKPK
jgi:hypothetical protein